MRVINQYRGAVDVANLFIGGVSSTITTAALLAAKFTFLEGDVQDFQIDGDDISARITNTDYSTVDSAFTNDTLITDITETSGYLTSLLTQAFRLATSLFLVDLIGVDEITTEAFFGCSSLHVKDISLPNLVTASPAASAFRTLHPSTGETLSLPSCTTLTGSNTFRSFIFTIDLPACTTFGSIDTCAFGAGTVNIPIVTDLGGTAGNDDVFRLNTGAMIVNANPFLETNNGGSPDGDLANVTTRGGTVTYTVTSGIPNPVIDLATDFVTSTALRIDWSVPIGGNTIKEYNIYVDDVLHDTTPLLVYTIFNLTHLQTYKIVVKAVDYTNTESADSNILNVLINGDPIPLVDIVSRYTFEDNVNDVVGSNNGAGTAITYVTDGGVGKSGEFNGTTSKIVVPDAANLSFTDGNDLPFSFSFLVKFDNISGESFFFNKRDNSSDNEYTIQYNGTLWAFQLFSGATGNQIRLLFTTTPNTDQWYHITATYDGGEVHAGLKLYIDGVDTAGATSAVGSYVGMIAGVSDVGIGSKIWTSGGFLTGQLDEVIIWDEELSASETLNVATEQLAGNDIDP